MANDSKIVIMAGLQIPETVQTITKDLKQVADQLNANHALKITANIDLGKSTQRIQSQLATIGKDLKLNVASINAQSIQQSVADATKNQGVKVKLSTEVDTKVVNADVDKIKKMFQLGIKGGTLTEFRQELKPLLQEFANAYKELDENRVQQAFQNILNFIDRTKNETIVLDEALKETQATLRQMIQAEGAINIDKVVKGDLLNIFNSIEQVEQALTTVFGKKGVGWAFTEMGKTTFSGFDTVAEQFKIEYNNLAEGIAGLYDILSQPIPKGNVFNVIGDLNDLLNSLASSLNLPTNLFEIFGNDVNMLFANIDEISKMQTSVQGVDTAIQSLGIDAKQTDAAIEGLLADVNKYPDIAKITSGFSTNNADQLTYAKNQLNDYFTNIVQVEDKANRVKNAIADTEGELQRFYIQVEKGDKSVETLTYVLNEEANAYQFLSKSIREADNSTDFRRKGLDTLTEINTEKVSQFITQLKEANLYTGDLKTRADELKDSISKVTDTNAMNKFLDEFDIAKAKFQALKAESKSLIPTNEIKSAMSELDKIINNTQFSKQKNSLAGMIGDTNTLKDLQSSFESAVKNASTLKDEYQQLSNVLKSDSSPESIKKVDEELNVLRGEFEATTERARGLQTQLSVLNTYAESYQKIISLNQKLSSDNITQKETEQIYAQIQAQKDIITEATKKLQIENLYTKALEDQKIAIKNNANEIINQRNQQKLNNQATEEYNKALRKQETELNTLRSAYKAIATQTATLVSSKSTDADKARAEEEIRYQRERIDAVWRVNTYEEMLNGIRSKAIAQGEQLISLAVQGVQEEERKADKIKAQAEAQRDYNKTLSDSNKLINDTIKALNDFNNSSVAHRNSANTNVQSQIATNTGLISQLQGFSQSLKDDSSVGNVQRIKAELDALIPTLEKATNDSAALKIQLRDMATDNKLAANLKNLESRMTSFAARNREAVNSTDLMRDGVMTYAEKWQELMDRMKSTNDAAGFQRLKEDVVAYENELRSVGKVTSGFVTSLKSQLKMLVSRWVSLYAVIAKIRQAVNYVIELDDAMTKLKRVTNETTEGYERFLEVAKKSAKETYTTLTDTVTQAARWAKNGFDAATSAELAKTSLIYSIVGDIDNDTAVSDLVTALRGFRLEAEDAMSIVDKLDALNNKYATDAKSLGEALTVTSSAMSAAGNDLDETLALITGATEITQNAKETGQALRTITMRIRGKLYASIWGNSYAMK